jgi:tRNA wybutosine-synthesizing protein 3
MTASLHHAQPILTAAINAGFRESGIQSLKNLEDANVFPMVAIRTAGLALESIVGVVSEREENEYPNTEEVEILVSEGYLTMLVKLANERFKNNAERMRRFKEDLFRREAGSEASLEWEDSKARQERKRAEGLKLQEEVRNRRMKEANFDFE